MASEGHNFYLVPVLCSEIGIPERDQAGATAGGTLSKAHIDSKFVSPPTKVALFGPAIQTFVICAFVVLMDNVSHDNGNERDHWN